VAIGVRFIGTGYAEVWPFCHSPSRTQKLLTATKRGAANIANLPELLGAEPRREANALLHRRWRGERAARRNEKPRPSCRP